MTDGQPYPKPAAESGADGWFTPWRFAALLAGLIVITFPGIIFGQETFFFRDFGVFGYPLAHYQRECFWRGELPFWNPLNSCGMPFLAQWNTLALYPLSVFYLIFPLSWSLGVFNLGHLFLAGMGMYALVRQWTNNRFAAAVAGLVFAFNGLTWHALMWPNDIAGLGWMPWVVLTVERAWRDGGRRIVWAALVGGMQMLTGAPEVILLTWTFIGVLCVTQLIRGEIPRWPRFLRFVLVVVLVAGLAVAQLLPFLQLLGHSQRDTTYSNEAGWAMPLSGIANLIAPMFHCFKASQGVFMQRDQYWIASYYTGIGTLLLAFTMLWRPKKRRIWLLLVTAIISLWMALGENGHLYSIIHSILPAVGFMRYPVKFVVLAVFALPILAAYGIKRCSTEPGNSITQQRVLLGIGMAMLILLGVITTLAWKYPLNGDDWVATWHNLLTRAGLLIAIVGLLTGIRRATSNKDGIILRIALLLLFWTDVRTHAPNLSPTVSRSVYAEDLIRSELKLPLRHQLGEPRMLASETAREQLHNSSITNAAYDYLCRRVALFDNVNLIDGLSKIDGFYSLDIKEVSEVVSLVYGADAHGKDLSGLKNFLGVARVNPRGPNQQNALEWIVRTNYMPLVTVGQEPYFADATNSLRALNDPNFDARQMVVLPLMANGVVQAKPTKPVIAHLEIHAAKISLEVTAEAPAMIVIAQAYYKPWHAYVDGKAALLWQANHAFQALQIPTGKHVVKIVYEDRAFYLGAIVSFVSLIALGIIWVFLRRA